MNQKEWYGARTVYKHIKDMSSSSSFHLYEERVIVIQALSFDDAIIEAEKEAREYAGENSEIKYLEFVNVFKLFADKIENRTEVYSLMRENNLDENGYLDRFFDTGFEKTK